MYFHGSKFLFNYILFLRCQALWKGSTLTNSVTWPYYALPILFLQTIVRDSRLQYDAAFFGWQPFECSEFRKTVGHIFIYPFEMFWFIERWHFDSFRVLLHLKMAIFCSYHIASSCRYGVYGVRDYFVFRCIFRMPNFWVWSSYGVWWPSAASARLPALPLSALFLSSSYLVDAIWDWEIWRRPTNDTQEAGRNFICVFTMGGG